jgi:hypothetical protein
MGVVLFPIIICWTVAVFGFRYSYVSPIYQNQNINIVGTCILVAALSGVLVAISVLSHLKSRPSLFSIALTIPSPKGAESIILGGILLLAAIGLFKSFDGTIFVKEYTGAVYIWLGYGAWSVTFLLLMCMLFGTVIALGRNRFLTITLATIIFIPFLANGSRIDYLSFMMALIVSRLILENGTLKNRIFSALGIFFWTALVAKYIGAARYQNFKLGLTFNDIGLKEDNIFHLSTFGDLGASVFQVVGLLKHGVNDNVGIMKSFLSYAHRLLPGPFFTDRPKDFWLELSEPIGGGALHSIGEGYLISGLAGCAAVGAVFGLLIAISIFAGINFRKSPSALMWTIAVFPWLLLIRGGWYQFFAIFKSLQVFLLIICLIILINFAWGLYKKHSFFDCASK